MPTCPRCGALIEQNARECWHCAAVIEPARAVGEVAVAATVSLAEAGAAEPSSWAGARPTMIGREILGQYVIVAKLGEGGMGEVYLADQPAIGRQVAVKIVHPPARERDHADHVVRFRNEAKAAASLASPHIVQIYNWGELADGTLFMAMEYLRGQTLAELLAARGALDAELAVAIAEQICSALVEAHAAGIIHRDLKPSNIMLVERGDQPHFVKVLDFGVAKLEGADITRSGAMFGTPQYMSPEQLLGAGLDGRSDLYSLGVLLYEMLTGQPPFTAPSLVAFVTAHLHRQPPPLASSVPRALAEVVLLLLSKEPDERPADASAVIAELRAALGGRSPAARRRARQRALRRSLGLAAGLAVLVGVGSIGWRVWRWQADTAEALARERAHTEALERKVRETEAAAERAREEARTAARDARRASDEVRERRQQVQRSRDRGSRRLDADGQAMLERSRAQLEADLREVFDTHRVPPSEIADVWAGHAARVAAAAAGELSEAELREQLVAMIELYEDGFEAKDRGDRLPLDRLELLFSTMRLRPELDAEQRQAMLDAIYDEVDHDPSLPEIDREYYKRLAVAALIREHGVRGPSSSPGPDPAAGAGAGVTTGELEIAGEGELEELDELEALEALEVIEASTEPDSDPGSGGPEPGPTPSELPPADPPGSTPTRPSLPSLDG